MNEIRDWATGKSILWMTKSGTPYQRGTKVSRARRVAALFLGFVLLCLAAPAVVFAQQDPASGGAAVSADEVEKQRQLDEKIEIIRKAFVSGNYAEVLRLCNQADQIMPNNDSVRLYREWAYQRLQQSKVGRQADVEPSEAKAPNRQSFPEPTQGTVATPVAGQYSSEQQNHRASTNGRDVPAQANQASQRPGLPTVVGIVVVLLGVVVVALFLIANKSRSRRLAGEERMGELAKAESSPQATPADLKSAPKSEPALASSGGESLAPSPTSALGGGLDLSSAPPGLGLPSAGSALVSQQFFASAGAPEKEPLTEGAPEDKPVSPSALGPAEPPVPEVSVADLPPITTEQPWEAPSARDFDLGESLPSEASQPREIPNIVSFEDLGIELPVEEPLSPSQKNYTAHLDESKIVITPAQKSPKEMKPETSPASPRVDSEAQTLEGSVPSEVPSIQLEDILGGASALPESPVAEVRPPADADVAEEIPEVSAQETFASLPPEPSAIEPLELESLTLQLAEGELDGLSSPAEAPPTEDVSTIILSPLAKSSSVPPRAAEPDETQTLKAQVPPQDAALAETKVVELPTSIVQPSVAAHEKASSTPPHEQAPSEELRSDEQLQKLDERSERMFHEQYQRGLRAFEEQNYKQAVHFLSIAAAIHPENQEVRQKLRLAREKKRQMESSR